MAVSPAGSSPAPASTRAALSSLVLPVYLPWLSAGLVVGMLVPVLPLYLRDADLSFSMVSVVLAASGVGAALGGLPAGELVGRLGERRLLVLALLTTALVTATLGTTTTVVALVALQAVAGASSIGIRLANQTMITRTVAVHSRGRAMSLMGGTMRLSFLIGPLVGGFLLETAGARTTFVIIGAVALVGVLPVLVVGGRAEGGGLAPPSTADRVRLVDALRDHRRLLVNAGLATSLVMTVRTGRLVVLPLVGDALGLGPTAVGALVAVGTGADLLLFPVAGYVMDRFGRLAAMVPAFGLLAVGLFLLAAAQTATMAIVAGVVMGVGNGMSSGTLLTVGSDLAPPDSPGPFLAALAAMQDTGKVLGPLLVGWFADAAGLGTSAFVLGVVMVVAIGWIVTAIGETAHRSA